MLRIGVEHRHAAPHSGKLRRQIPGNGGLSHPALPPRHGDDGHKQYYTGKCPPTELFPEELSAKHKKVLQARREERKKR